jgi:alpha-1,6-mannosyltransferase
VVSASGVEERTPRHGRRRPGRALSTGAVVVAAGATVELIRLRADHAWWTGALLVGLAALGYVAALVAHDRWHRLDIRLVFAAVGVTLAFAVGTPSRASNDLWSYTMYGRMITVHGADPYRHSPADFPSDPFVQRVSSGWRHTRSVYGPAFTLYSVLGVGAVGDSALGSRLFFQATAAAAVLAALVLLWRRTRDPAVVAFVGLNPVTAASVVNGGHNDALLGLAILAAVLLATDGRSRAAGALLGIAILVKVSAALALGALALWAWRRRGRRVAVEVGLPAVAIATGGYLLAPGALGTLRSAPGHMSRASVWQWPRHFLVGPVSGRLWLNDLTHRQALGQLTEASVVVVLVVAAGVAWQHARDRDPALAAGGTTLAYSIFGIYILPWYGLWALPALALRRRAWLAWLATADAIVLLGVYQFPQAINRGRPDPIARDIVSFAIPLLMLFAFAVAMVADRRSTERAAPAVQPPVGASYTPPP